MPATRNARAPSPDGFGARRIVSPACSPRADASWREISTAGGSTARASPRAAIATNRTIAAATAHEPRTRIDLQCTGRDARRTPPAIWLHNRESRAPPPIIGLEIPDEDALVLVHRFVPRRRHRLRAAAGRAGARHGGHQPRARTWPDAG